MEEAKAREMLRKGDNPAEVLQPVLEEVVVGWRGGREGACLWCGWVLEEAGGKKR